MKKEILVIDDNPDLRFLICKILKEENYEIRSAANYDQAAKEIKKKLPDLAIIDIKLDKSDKDGMDLLKLIMSIQPTTPVIMISGHATVQIAVESIRLGAYEFIEKGTTFSTDKLLNYVARAIDDDQLNYVNAKIPKKSVIFNDLDLDWSKPIVLVEGVFDAIKSIENSVPLLGSSLAKDSELYKKLMKNQSKVVVAIDSDLKLKGYKIAENLFEAGCKVMICFPPDGKDMGDLTKEENKKIIENAEAFSPYSSLTFKIRSIRSGSII